MSAKKYVVFDRDGTLIHERHYLSDPEQIELIPGIVVGLRLLAELGFGLIIVTNQSGIGRGYFSEHKLAEIHARLTQLLAEEQISLDGIFYCPHTPHDGCDCRKPRPGMLLQAAQRFHFDPAQCFVVGDKPCDINLGKAVGATTILVKTGYGMETDKQAVVNPDYLVDTVKDIASTIQQHIQSLRTTVHEI
ncbi:MAG: D-glycero-beta-D-manno-heptose 1,7-bisphosphate 7-phosphatase [Cyanobacteria bacterium P01_D01_bin.56]